MAKQIEGYRCPYCQEKYDTAKAAQICAENCADVEGIIDCSMFKCEMCGNTFDTITKAEECEEKHTEKQDKIFQRWQEKERLRELVIAGNHHQQTKLISEQIKIN